MSLWRRQLDWRQVWILYRREMRAAFREKTIVVNSLLIPVFLYPFLLWAAFSAMIFVTGQTEGFVSRVAVVQWPKGHPALRYGLMRDTQFELFDARGRKQGLELGEGATPTDSGAGVELLEQRLRDGSLDAVIEFVPAAGPQEKLPGNFQVRLTYNQAKERSEEARHRLVEYVEQYRGDWLKRDGRQRGIEPAAWQGFTLVARNVASKKQMGAFLLGLIAPIIFVVMVAVGCFYPAVDAVAGERERSTWETLMSTSASRLSVVVAKYLHVASLGGMAGMLNLLAVMLTLRPIFGPLLAKTGQIIECTIAPGAIPVAILAALLLAGFIAAGMMIFAAFARTFKEGQAMITPFYMLILIPVVFLQAPGLQLTPALACVPIVNVTLMVREALTGVFHWLPITITLLASLTLIALSLRLAAYILQFEDVVMGSYGGSFHKFVRERMFRRQ